MKNKIKLSIAELKQLDTSLFNTIMDTGLITGTDTPQEIRWFIDTKDLTTAQGIVDKLNNVLPGIKSFSKFSIEITGKQKSPIIIINTPDFLFNINDITVFSRLVFEIAAKNGGDYDFWEIGI